MPQLNELILKLADVFERLSLPYAFGGAVAAAYWGTPRTTQDADCLVAVPSIQYQRLATELDAMGCVIPDSDDGHSPVTVTALRSQLASRKFMTVEWNSIRAELFVPVVVFQEEILRRAVWKPIGQGRIKVTTAEDLILLKMVFHRQKDILDIRGILSVQAGHLDVDFLLRQAAEILDAPTLGELESLVKSHRIE